MASMKIKKGDMVKVIAGRDKDKEGKVIAVNKKDNTLLVEGVNMVTKHPKPSMANQQGGILHQEGPIDASNVMYVHKGTATRVGIKMNGDKKVRYAKSTGEVIDDMEEKFGKIDAMTEEVNELKEQLYQLKENVKCPKCGAYNHSDDVYCSKCGERIYNVNSDDTDSYDDDEVVIINAKKPETEED